LKAISDSADFNLPALDRFVASDGSFHTVRFAYHIALRPWLWRTTIALARNSSKASQALCGTLASYLGREKLSGAKGVSPVQQYDGRAGTPGSP